MARMAFVVLMLTGFLLGQAGPLQTPADPGTVQGVVVRADTGAALEDARVTLSGGPTDPKALQDFLRALQVTDTIKPPEDNQVDERFIQSAIDAAAAKGVTTGYPPVRAAVDRVRAGREFTAMSDEAGLFTITGVPPGRYTVRAQREDFYGASSDAATAPVTVAPKQAQEVKLSLYPGAVIGGRILDSDGQSQPNATVTAFRVIYRDGFPLLQSVISRTSDDRGEYRLFWLPAGAYLISAAPRVLARAPEGRGAGIAAQPVSPSQVASMKQQFVTTFYPGTADPKNATAVSVPRSGEVVAVDITLRRATPARISGQIQFARSGAARGAPTTTAEIMVLQRDSNAPEPDVVSEGRIVGTATLTGDNGTFLVTGILPGAYDLYARLPFPNTDGGAPTTYGRTSIDVQERDLTNVSIAVYGHARVNGTVRIDDRAPSAVPVRIALEPEGSAAKIPVYRNIAVRPVVAGGDGTFMVPAVLPGRYRLKIANELPPEVYVADVLQGGSSIFDQGFEFGAEAPPPIQVVLRSGAAALNGVVRDSADKPVAGATVVLVPLDRRQNRGLYATRVADASGQFSIRSLAPGVYKVFAWEQAIVAGSYYNATFLSRYEDRGQSVNLTQTATGTVTITAIPAGE